jgi:hypothetical protein
MEILGIWQVFYHLSHASSHLWAFLFHLIPTHFSQPMAHEKQNSFIEV